jgi:hypothetical protein
MPNIWPNERIDSFQTDIDFAELERTPSILETVIHFKNSNAADPDR